MTNKEACNVFTDLLLGKSVEPRKTSDALSIARLALIEADEHRWHDIEENPSDLPEKYQKVEIATVEKGTRKPGGNFFTEYGMSINRVEIDRWQPPFQYFGCHYDIVAWRIPYEYIPHDVRGKWITRYTERTQFSTGVYFECPVCGNEVTMRDSSCGEYKFCPSCGRELSL